MFVAYLWSEGTTHVQPTAEEDQLIWNSRTEAANCGFGH
jgi:hypothetical protein